jgi:AAA+ superfamily predicted ATPase
MRNIKAKDSRYNAISRRMWKMRPRNAGLLIARNLTVRALRKAGLSHVLRDQMAIVGILYPPSIPVQWLIQAGNALLRQVTSKPHACIEFPAGTGRRSKDSRSADLADTLIENNIVLGFAKDTTHFPDVFRFTADRIIPLGLLDRRTIDVTFQAIVGTLPSTDVLEAVEHLPPELLAAAVLPGRSLKTIFEIVQRHSSSSRQNPSTTKIDAYYGFGEAADWGKALAADLADYAAGRIAWAKVDRGALISDPSGTGKTMLVQVLAATCEVPLFAHSLARWQAQGHLGDLLAAMNAAFDEATNNAPCILFIDELDSIGSRDQFSGEHEKYSREVVNGLLECVDGVGKREGVVVIGATNMTAKIDPALLRPGRLGRHLQIMLPDAEARSGILRHHLSGDLTGEDLSYAVSCLDGATGAVIEQVVRDARRFARTERREMTTTDIATALPARIRLSDAAFVRVCIHEAGHAVVGHLLSEVSGNILVETKVSREFMVGHVGNQTSFHRIPGFDRTRAAYIAEITTLLAGLAAETVILGEHADGGGGSKDSDLYLATILAAEMEVSFGLGAALACTTASDSEQLVARLDSDPALRRVTEVILAECMTGAQGLLREHRRALERIAREMAAATGLDDNHFFDIIELASTDLDEDTIRPIIAPAQ